MKIRVAWLNEAGRKTHAGVRAVGLFIALGSLALPQSYSSVRPNSQKGNTMTSHASGTFEVKLTPLAAEGASKEANLVKLSIDKQFQGELRASSKGEMLADSMAAKGSGGYVAMERVSGTLHGRRGTFVLQHSGTMTRGEVQLSITVVPGSGTEQLAGLAGKMSIRIAEGKHYYDLEYTLAGAAESSVKD